MDAKKLAALISAGIVGVGAALVSVMLRNKNHN